MTSNVPIIKPAFGRQIRFPYTEGLEDKEFEELLFSIFERHRVVGQKPYCDEYDTAHLMPGVGDDGQDVVLTKAGQRVGLIQCKRYKSSLTKPQCAQEIIKFTLNAICNPRLLTNQDQFTYYLVASNDFSEPAISLIASFNRLIGQEPELEKWTTKVISKYQASFGHLTFQSVQADLKHILSNIKVEKINATKLNGWLAEDAYHSIAKQFFPAIILVTTATNGVTIPKLTDAQVIDRFYNASSDLLTWPATFERAGHYHLEREETGKLLTWIDEPIEQDDKDQLGSTVAMLVGGAGYGKTTVLQDLLLQLHQRNVPVIGLKADRLVLLQRNDLEQELHLPNSLNDLVEQLASSHSRVVVLVDQLDALSQSMSANRQGLQTYNRLIEQLATLANIRLVISCRQYDLDYDPALFQYKQRHTVYLQPLSEAQVIDVLERLELNKAVLTPKLYQLLQVPLHLSIFCQVYRDDTDIDALATVQDLYHELWSQKILNVPVSAVATSAEVRAVVQQIADQMYEWQQISVPFRKFESDHKAAINYLISQSLITLTKPKIQFFHQSFFDYVFARSFVDRGLSITADIAGQHGEAKHQGLFIRSKVRQVLTYLREVNVVRYAREVRTLLTSPSYRFHIKLLTLQHLASQAQPIHEEKRLAEQVIWSESLLWEAFLEAVGTPNWFRFIANRFANEYFLLNTRETSSRLYQLCRRVQRQCPDDIVHFLSRLPDVAQRREFISNVLFVLEDYSNPITNSLFEEANEARIKDDLWFYHVMEHAIASRPEWVGNQIQARLLKSIEQIEVQYGPQLPFERHSDQLVDTLEKLHQQAPYVAFSTGLTILEAFILKAKPFEQEWSKTKLIVDSAFNRYLPIESIHEAHQSLLDKLETWIAALLDHNETVGYNQVSVLLDSEHLTLISLGLQGVIHQPIVFADVFYEKSSRLLWLEAHDQINHDYFSRAVRKALEVCFPNMPDWQQQAVINQILALNIKSEYQASVYRKPIVFRWTGQTEYELLNLLPSTVLLQDTRVKKRYQELERKFGPYKPTVRSGRLIFSSGRSMSDQSYDYMSDADWLKSFLSYDARKGWQWEKVDESTHARRFTEEVKQRPARFLALIEAIIDRQDVPNSYVYHGLEGLQEANYDPVTFKRLFFKSVSRSQEDSYVSRMVRLTDYWINRKEYDSSAFDFLENLARDGAERTEVRGDIDLYNQGVNTIRGAALYRLYQWVHVDGFTERCFQVMEQVAADGALATRAVALYEQAQFNHHDKQRSLRLFLSLCFGYEVALAEIALHSLPYDIHIDFAPLIPFFEQCVKASKARHILAQILTVAYANGYPGSEELLERYIQADVDGINGTLDVALTGLTDTNKARRERCWRIALRFLEHTDEKVNQAYLGAFRKFDVTEFSQLLPFLEAYAQSEVGRKREHEFYAYLLNCAGQHAQECIRLTSFFDRHLGPDLIHRNLQNEPIDVVLQAYNTFGDYTGQTVEKEQAMDVFDRMMQNSDYRGMMNQITDKLG